MENDYWKEYRKKNKDKILSQKKERYNTQKGRSICLINNYRNDDKDRGFETSVDFDYNWLIEHIFTKCIYCGETDWHKLGCDRIDNNKPHSKDNVVPCCKKCNDERRRQDFENFYKNKLGVSPTS